MARHRIGAADSISPGTAICFEAENKTIAIFNLSGDFYAIDDECSHVGGPLSFGRIVGHEVECPWHAARFDIKTGAALCSPADCDLKTYPVIRVGSDLEIEL